MMPDCKKILFSVLSGIEFEIELLNEPLLLYTLQICQRKIKCPNLFKLSALNKKSPRFQLFERKTSTFNNWTNCIHNFGLEHINNGQ